MFGGGGIGEEGRRPLKKTTMMMSHEYPSTGASAFSSSPSGSGWGATGSEVRLYQLLFELPHFGGPTSSMTSCALHISDACVYKSDACVCKTPVTMPPIRVPSMGMSCPALLQLPWALLPCLRRGPCPPCRPAPSPSHTSTPGLSPRQWLIHLLPPLSHDVSGHASPVGVWRGGPILAATTVGYQPLGTSHSPLLSCHAEIPAQPRLGGTRGAVRVERGVESRGKGDGKPILRTG